MRVPQTAVWSQPGVELLKGLGPNSVHAPLRIGPGFDQAGVAHHPEVLGDRWLAEPQSLDQLADGPLTGSQIVEDGLPARFAEDLEGGSGGHPAEYDPRGI